ncbi:MAG: tryptophan synthase subunit alpha, partial [Acidobacteria bacterium]|nr:tryptophan synthase subunit alpha [Acidobacteriota bacterium]
VACVGGGSNAAGIFSAFVPHERVRLVGVEAGGRGDGPGEHAARFASGGRPGVLHGTFTWLLQDEEGQVLPTHSVSAGMDYPAIGPEHAMWRDTGRVSYTRVGDEKALDAFDLLSRSEGIIPALESAHAVAYAVAVAPAMPLKATCQPLRTGGQGHGRGRPVAGRWSVKRIARAFASAKKERRAAFVAYVTAGHPSLEGTVEIARALRRAGADILELGVPFSDPIADGPTNQRAAERSLAGGTTPRDVLETVSAIRSRGEDIPIVLFTYANPVLAYGVERFARDAAAAGADGVLLTDVPVEELGRFKPHFEDAHLDTIVLVAPTSTKERIKAASRQGSGFLYLVSRTGVTGAQAELADDLESKVRTARKLSRLPVAVGFGISTPQQVARVARIADGVVVGSAIVDRIDRVGDERHLAGTVQRFVTPLAAACRR